MQKAIDLILEVLFTLYLEQRTHLGRIRLCWKCGLLLRTSWIGKWFGNVWPRSAGGIWGVLSPTTLFGLFLLSGDQITDKFTEMFIEIACVGGNETDIWWLLINVKHLYTIYANFKWKPFSLIIVCLCQYQWKRYQEKCKEKLVFWIVLHSHCPLC